MVLPIFSKRKESSNLCSVQFAECFLVMKMTSNNVSIMRKTVTTKEVEKLDTQCISMSPV